MQQSTIEQQELTGVKNKKCRRCGSGSHSRSTKVSCPMHPNFVGKKHPAAPSVASGSASSSATATAAAVAVATATATATAAVHQAEKRIVGSSSSSACFQANILFDESIQGESSEVLTAEKELGHGKFVRDCVGPCNARASWASICCAGD